MIADVVARDRHAWTSCSGRSTGERRRTATRRAHRQRRLSEPARAEIDRRLKQVPGRSAPSAVIGGAARRAAPEYGCLTTGLMDAVAEYLGIPPNPGLRDRELLFDVRTGPRAQARSGVHQHQLHAARRPMRRRGGLRPNSAFAPGRALAGRPVLSQARGRVPRGMQQRRRMMMIDHVYYEDLTPDMVSRDHRRAKVSERMSRTARITRRSEPLGIAQSWTLGATRGSAATRPGRRYCATSRRPKRSSTRSRPRACAAAAARVFPPVQVELHAAAAR